MKNVLKSSYHSLIIILAAIVVLLTGCSENDNIFQVSNGNSLNVEINVSAPEIIGTRATDSEINDLTVFLFSGDKNNFYGKQEFSNVSNGSNVTINLPTNANRNSLVLYGVANLKVNNVTLPEDPSSADDIEKVSLSSAIELNKGLLMSGVTEEISSNSTGVTLNLKRIVAKVSVTFSNSVKGYTYNGFELHNINKAGYLGSPSGKSEYKFNSTYLRETKTIAENNHEIFVYPSKGSLSETNLEDQSFLILKAKRNNSDRISYYRLDFINSESKTKLDLLSNHYYEVEIISIESEGFSTSGEAANHSENSGVLYTIHDHSKNVLSMVSNGVQELGVTNKLELEDLEGTKVTEAEFIVRLACAEHGVDCTAYPSISGSELNSEPFKHIVGEDYSVEITEGTSWLSLKRVELATGEDEMNANGNEVAEETGGNRYKYILNVDPDAGVGGEMTGRIKVTWMGLNREIPVRYKTEFHPENKCTVTLNILPDGTISDKKTIAGYWDFLAGRGTSDSQSTANGQNSIPILNGMVFDPGKVRNQGFHFPVMYGDSESTLWVYNYEIDFTKLERSDYYQVSKVTYETTGDPYFSNNIDITTSNKNEPGKFTLALKNIKGYAYAVGQIVFYIEVTSGGGDVLNYTIPFDLYHTGFFHFERTGTNKGEYFYYEVVELEPGQYWLDRNCKAKNNGLYIETESGVSIFTNESYPFTDDSSRGASVTVASKGTYSTPNLNLNKICPPGYRIPTQAEFDKVRTSSRFYNDQRSTSNTTYYTSYYDSPTVGPVYFPKGRFLNKNEKAGDDRSGYYWTQTTAAGLEKEQIGNWLKVLYLSGNSSSYVYGDVTNHQMSLRCIAVTGNETAGRVPEENYTIGFKVKGATGVYLYTENTDAETGETIRSGIFNFPGKAIGDYKMVENCNNDEEDKYLQFSYTSTIPANELFVYFTYTDKNGKIWVISSNGNSYTHDNTPGEDGFENCAITGSAGTTNSTEIKGWPVWVNYSYKFLWKDLTASNLELSGSKIYLSQKPEEPKEEEEGVKYRLFWQGPNDDRRNMFLNLNGVNKHEYNSNYEDYNLPGWHYIIFSSNLDSGTIGMKVDWTICGENNSELTFENALNSFSTEDNEGYRNAYLEMGSKTLKKGTPPSTSIIEFSEFYLVQDDASHFKKVPIYRFYKTTNNNWETPQLKIENSKRFRIESNTQKFGPKVVDYPNDWEQNAYTLISTDNCFKNNNEFSGYCSLKFVDNEYDLYLNKK